MAGQTEEQYFGFTNDVIFGWVMKNKDNCLAVLRAILPDLNITGIVDPDTQHDITPVQEARGARLDVVVHDDQQRFYDIEMQVVDYGDLGQRACYYQSQIDNETLKKGEDFEDLKESFVIFLSFLASR